LSSEQDQVRQLAERIARRVAESAELKTVASSVHTGELNGELAAMRRSLAELQERLVRIESHLAPEDRAAQGSPPAPFSHQDRGRERAREEVVPVPRSPWLSGMYVPAAHPSQEKFGVEEATVSELVDFFEGTKTCELEPGGKPCDHCALCSSRGF
jgi:hypothetical protein